MKKLGILALFMAFLSMPVSAYADEVAVDELNKKLSQIITTQAQILTELAEIKKELEIVKVRATLAGA